jgi:hypothetical protein
MKIIEKIEEKNVIKIETLEDIKKLDLCDFFLIKGIPRNLKKEDMGIHGYIELKNNSFVEFTSCHQDKKLYDIIELASECAKEGIFKGRYKVGLTYIEEYKNKDIYIFGGKFGNLEYKMEFPIIVTG